MVADGEEIVIARNGKPAELERSFYEWSPSDPMRESIADTEAQAERERDER